jgi:hypothetical protein
MYGQLTCTRSVHPMANTVACASTGVPMTMIDHDEGTKLLDRMAPNRDKCWSMEYTGIVYPNPPSRVVDLTDITGTELSELIAHNRFHNLGVYFEHQSDNTESAGYVVNACIAQDGSAAVGFRLDLDTAAGRKVDAFIQGRKRANLPVMLSLAHYRDPRANRVVPLEVSVCTEGARPGAYVVRMSKHPTGNYHITSIAPVEGGVVVTATTLPADPAVHNITAWATRTGPVTVDTPPAQSTVDAREPVDAGAPPVPAATPAPSPAAPTREPDTLASQTAAAAPAAEPATATPATAAPETVAPAAAPAPIAPVAVPVNVAPVNMDPVTVDRTAAAPAPVALALPLATPPAPAGAAVGQPPAASSAVIQGHTADAPLTETNAQVPVPRTQEAPASAPVAPGLRVADTQQSTVAPAPIEPAQPPAAGDSGAHTSSVPGVSTHTTNAHAIADAPAPMDMCGPPPQPAADHPSTPMATEPTAAAQVDQTKRPVTQVDSAADEPSAKRRVAETAAAAAPARAVPTEAEVKAIADAVRAAQAAEVDGSAMDATDTSPTEAAVHAANAAKLKQLEQANADMMARLASLQAKHDSEERANKERQDNQLMAQAAWLANVYSRSKVAGAAALSAQLTDRVFVTSEAGRRLVESMAIQQSGAQAPPPVVGHQPSLTGGSTVTDVSSRAIHATASSRPLCEAPQHGQEYLNRVAAQLSAFYDHAARKTQTAVHVVQPGAPVPQSHNSNVIVVRASRPTDQRQTSVQQMSQHFAQLIQDRVAEIRRLPPKKGVRALSKAGNGLIDSWDHV